jgi:hypothetical protein
LIGGKIDLLSLFPQKDARNMGGMERESKLLKVNNEAEREGLAYSPRKKKGAFYSLPTKYGRCRIFRPDYPAPGAKIRPKIRPLTGRCAQKSLAEIRGPDYSNNPPPFQPGLSGLEENINTKTAITFASGLHFR